MEEHILTEEIKQQLLGAAPFCEGAIYEYVSKYHRILKNVPEHFIPKFKLEVLNRAEKDKMIKWLKGDISKIENKDMRNFLMPKIKGWENFYDIGNSSVIEFSEENKAKIPDNICSDLLFELIKVAGLLEIDRLSLRYLPQSIRE
jgi:hypothetical protein